MIHPCVASDAVAAFQLKSSKSVAIDSIHPQAPPNIFGGGFSRSQKSAEKAEKKGLIGLRRNMKVFALIYLKFYGIHLEFKL